MRGTVNKIIIAGVFILMIVQVIVANRLTSIGLTVAALDAKNQSFIKENDDLERKIATLSSLTKISQRAEASGFIKSQIVFLKPEISVALNNLNGTTR